MNFFFKSAFFTGQRIPAGLSGQGTRGQRHDSQKFTSLPCVHDCRRTISRLVRLVLGTGRRDPLRQDRFRPGVDGQFEAVGTGLQSDFETNFS